VIVGRFHTLLETLAGADEEAGLCRYVAAVRARNDMLLVVAEHFGVSLATELAASTGGLEESRVAEVAFGVLRSLAFLHARGVIVRNLSLENIRLDANHQVRLCDYGLFFVTAAGCEVAFAVGEPNYLSPELVAVGPRGLSSPKCDIWALGIILVALLCGRLPWADVSDPLTILQGVTLFAASV
jgi:serine/threonine protein kinase